jgi:succinate-acetate transporter protein
VLIAVFSEMRLRGLTVMTFCLEVMTVRQVGVMSCFLVVAGFVVLGGLVMMLRGMFVMLGGFLVVLMRFVSHGDNSFFCFFRLVGCEARLP